MSCRTGYLLREPDSSGWVAAIKYGDWLIVDRDRLDAVVGWVKDSGVAVGRATAGSFDDACCQGVAIDLLDQRYRYFPCRRGVARDEITERAVRGTALWRGWDVGLARGGREELGALIPEASGVVKPYAWMAPPLGELPLSNRDGWFAEWRADADTLYVHDDVASADWAGHGCYLITVVHVDQRIRDYRVHNRDSAIDDLLPWLTHGRPLLDALEAAAPFPLPGEGLADGGVVLDVPGRIIRHWSAQVAPPSMVEQIRLAWPGWRVERLTYGLAGHLAVTARRCPELLDDPTPETSMPLAAQTILRDTAAGWDAERRALPLDPRPLRPPRIAVRQT